MKATFIEGFRGILLNVRKEKNFFVKESPKPLLVNEKRYFPILGEKCRK